jgi:hypothetical protein
MKVEEYHHTQLDLQLLRYEDGHVCVNHLGRGFVASKFRLHEDREKRREQMKVLGFTLKRVFE